MQDLPTVSFPKSTRFLRNAGWNIPNTKREYTEKSVKPPTQYFWKTRECGENHCHFATPTSHDLNRILGKWQDNLS
jgi:hypothetical protein